VNQQTENETIPLPDSLPLTPLLQDIQDSFYENIPSLSAIPSLPATPSTPAGLASTLKRATRSKQPKAPAPKRRKKQKKLQLTYHWKKAIFRHRAQIETDENDFVDLPETDSPLAYFYMFFSRDILSDIVEQTNFYSVQELGRSIQLTVDELRLFSNPCTYGYCPYAIVSRLLVRKISLR
jgi:hypothetical protein